MPSGNLFGGRLEGTSRGVPKEAYHLAIPHQGELISMVRERVGEHPHERIVIVVDFLLCRAASMEPSLSAKR